MLIQIDSEKDLEIVAAKLAPLLKTGDVLTLTGGLGAGKTALSRTLIRALSSEETEVPSPTFTLIQTYDLPQFSLSHFDLYRLPEKEMDVLELGWDDARHEGVCLVEWPDRLGALMPKDRLDIHIDFHKTKETGRIITLTPHGSWTTRLA